MKTLKSIAVIGMAVALMAYGCAFLWMGLEPGIAAHLQTLFAWSGVGSLAGGGLMLVVHSVMEG